jgi:hypothetical protein
MGFYLFLEVDNGDLLQIIRPDGNFAGKGLLNFQNAYSNYDTVHDANSLEYIWFQRFESLAQINLRKFWNIIYAGNWIYGEEEYERFKKCTENNPFKNEEEYKITVRAINNMWTPIDQLIAIVKEILRVLPKMGEDTYWYYKADTIVEFHGLLNTLLLAKSRYGKEARLKGE